jgi:hypothetical protein
MQILLASIAALHLGSDPVRLALLGAALFVAARTLRGLDGLLAARDLRRVEGTAPSTKNEEVPEIRLRTEVRLRRDPGPNVEVPEHVGSD